MQQKGNWVKRMSQSTVVLQKIMFQWATALVIFLAACTRSPINLPRTSIVEVYSCDGEGLCGSGSGFFVNSTGLVLTAYHIQSRHIGRGPYVSVWWSPDLISADIVAIDPIRDLMLLQTPIGRSRAMPSICRSIMPEDTVISIGRPGSLFTYSYGNVRNPVRYAMTKNFCTTSRIWEGFSGGAVVSYGSTDYCTLGVIIRCINHRITGACTETIAVRPSDSNVIWTYLLTFAPNFTR